MVGLIKPQHMPMLDEILGVIQCVHYQHILKRQNNVDMNLFKLKIPDKLHVYHLHAHVATYTSPT